MPLLTEFRIPLPLDLEEFRIAQRYSAARYCRDNTKPGPQGEGFQILKNEPFDDENGKGQFTHKRINLASRLPAFARNLVPGSLVIDEHSWNAFPDYGKNVYSCPFFGDKFSIVVESKFLSDDGNTENALNLPPEKLKKRKVELIDIIKPPKEKKDYRKHEDPTLFLSRKTGRGCLTKGWQKTATPRICVYKLAHVKFSVSGLQDIGEKWLMKRMVRDVMLMGNRQLVCWMDEWFGLSMEDIAAIDEANILVLQKMREGQDVRNVPLVPDHIRARRDLQYPDLPGTSPGDRIIEASASGMRLLQLDRSIGSVGSSNGSSAASSAADKESAEESSTDDTDYSADKSSNGQQSSSTPVSPAPDRSAAAASAAGGVKSAPATPVVEVRKWSSHPLELSSDDD